MNNLRMVPLRLVVCVPVLAIALLAALFGVAPAWADDVIEDGHSYFVQSAKSGRNLCIQADSRRDGAKAALAKPKENARYQKFRFVKAGKTSWRIQSVSSSRYLCVKGKKVVQRKRATGKAARWVVSVDEATGSFAIASAAAKDRCLEALGKTISVKGRSGSMRQLFDFVPTYGFKLYLDPGHGQSGGSYDPGAPGSGREEADLTKDLVKRIETALEGSDIKVVNGEKLGLAYWRRNAKAAELKCDAALSVHFDVGGGYSTMTMVGTRGPLALSKAFDKIIHKRLVASTGLRDGGTTHRGDITFVNGKVPAVLMEVCFIDNYSALNKYLSRRDIVAASLAEGVIEASRTWGMVRGG